MSAVPVLPDEGGTVISGMDTEDKSVREGTVTHRIVSFVLLPIGQWVYVCASLRVPEAAFISIFQSEGIVKWCFLLRTPGTAMSFNLGCHCEHPEQSEGGMAIRNTI